MTETTTVPRSGDDGVSDRVANHNMRWWILGVLGIAQLMVILDNTIVNIALPTAQHDLHFSNAFVVRSNPALDVMNVDVGIVVHLPGGGLGR